MCSVTYNQQVDFYYFYLQTFEHALLECDLWCSNSWWLQKPKVLKYRTHIFFKKTVIHTASSATLRYTHLHSKTTRIYCSSQLPCSWFKIVFDSTEERKLQSQQRPRSINSTPPSRMLCGRHRERCYQVTGWRSRRSVYLTSTNCNSKQWTPLGHSVTSLTVILSKPPQHAAHLMLWKTESQGEKKKKNIFLGDNNNNCCFCMIQWDNNRMRQGKQVCVQ